MTDLEKLLRQIEEESSQKVSALLRETQEQVKEVEIQGENERQDMRVKALAEIEKDKEVALKRAESAVLLHEKKMILAAKYEIVEAFLQKARAFLRDLDDEAYFKLITQLAKKYAKGHTGNILFTSKDYNRLTQATKEQLEALGLEVIKSERDFEDGFILTYGDIEENCSFDALFLEKKELLQDELGRYLFG